jgi:hypothetical protein
MTKRNLQILVSPGFMAGLCSLLLNDLILKREFHNGFTGKMSDFAGLFVFPLFWSAFFPRLRSSFLLGTALLFIFWKSSYSQPLINSWNGVSIFPIKRAVDHSDLFALLILPLSYFYRTSVPRLPARGWAIYLVAAISLFAFTATSYSKKTPYDKEFTFSTSKGELRKRISLLSTDELAPRFWESDSFEISFDSCVGRALITIRGDNNQSFIKLSQIDYRCPSGGNKQEMLEYFEKEFINKLREEPVTKPSQVNYIRPLPDDERSESPPPKSLPTATIPPKRRTR